MLIKCKTNRLTDLADELARRRLESSIHLDEADESLVVGQTYPVQALALWSDGGLRAYLHTDEQSDHPYPYPLEYFEVLDAGVPPNWVMQFRSLPGRLEFVGASFADWANDDSFYEKLVDGDPGVQSQYRRWSVK